ncbi:MAG: ShlB/FhaC/HecB family hemolysin secretion/activation protein [Spirulina sp. SIO3F2]|nr:ShlB/FhaC/HecB family hemolysin secretion/activation protein [Spirulina sp. SIO3F2]
MRIYQCTVLGLLLLISCPEGASASETVKLSQAQPPSPGDRPPSPLPELPPRPEDIQPPGFEQGEPTLSATDNCAVNTATTPEQILAAIEHTTNAPPEGIEIPAITGIRFVGNRAFSDLRLQKHVADQTDGKTEFTFTELIAIAQIITSFYNEKGYVNTWATVPEQIVDAQGRVAIAIIEGGISEIHLSRPKAEHRLNNAYICDRLALATRPLQLDQLLDALRQLQLNPLIQQINAQLRPGIYEESSILVVEVIEAPSLQVTAGLDNGRPPSVGTQRRLIQLSEGNVSGIGDRLALTFSNTAGSNNLDARYTLPLNARDGTLSLTLSKGASKVIEEPFDYLDLQGDSFMWELLFRQPLDKSAQHEVALSLGLGHRFSQTSILGFNFPLSEGADDEGRLRVTTLTFGQDWTRRSDQDFLSLRSRLSLGTNALGATVNPTAPDGRFFHWQAQGTWLHRFPNRSQLLVQGSLQLGDRPLLAQEQFTLGGLGTVRGYRQDVVSRDNGASLSLEYQQPLLGDFSDRWGLLSLATFADWGVGWQSAQRDEKAYQTLASLGLGLLWSTPSDLTVQAYWGLPLIEVDSRDNTLQERGFHFLVQSRWDF